MNVEVAKATVRSWKATPSVVVPLVVVAGRVLAVEVDRLRGELLKANAEQERLENQLDQLRGELVATCAKIEEWEDVIDDARDNLSAFLPFAIPAPYGNPANDRIPPRDTTERS